MADFEKELMAAQDALAVGDYEGAVSRYNKVIKADPKVAEAHFGKAEASIGVPKMAPEDVIECYRKAVELDPKNPLYHSSYGAYLVEIGRFNEAETAYLKAAELDPDNARYYFSEFAVEYATRAPVVMEKYLDDNTRNMIYKKGMKYMLKALGITEDEAKRLL